MERPYLDVEGNRQPRSAWDMHHTIPQSRARYSGGGCKRFIDQEGLVVPLFHIWHNIGKTALHSNVEHAPMPEQRLRDCINRALQETVGENVYDRFLDVLDVVTGLGDFSRDPGLSKDARRLASNFKKQTPYILQGQVRDLSEASRDITD